MSDEEDREKIGKRLFIQKHRAETWDDLVPEIKAFWLHEADQILAFIKENCETCTYKNIALARHGD